MKRRRPREAVPSIVGVSFALAGNLAGNASSAQLARALPKPFTDASVIVLLVVAACIVFITVLRRKVSGGALAQRSRRRKNLGLALVLLYDMLWGIGGLLANIAAPHLPSALTSHAGLLFIIESAVGVTLAAGDFITQSAPSTEDTDRRKFLADVESRYGHRQDDALRGNLRLVLGYVEAPKMVTDLSPANASSASTERADVERELPARAPISEVYSQAGRKLLILGEPGSGKTTLLFDLGLHLVRQARRDEQQPLPVIFNLASWANNRLSLKEWFIEDLEHIYQVPRSTAETWVGTFQILPLLDGLDELPDDGKRSACAEAIDAYLAAHPAQALLVCSREAEYQKLRVRLALQQAVVVQPLTDEQIMEYLDAGGPPLATLRQVVAQDAALRDVLRTPLMLRLVTLTYEDLAAEHIPPIGDVDAWRHRLFGQYVEKMLTRPRGEQEREQARSAQREETPPRYPPEEARRYLAWLATHMRENNLVEFHPDSLQYDWLPEGIARQRYRLGELAIVGLVDQVGVELVLALLVELTTGIFFGLVAGLVAGLVIAVGFGLAVWRAGVPGGAQRIHLVPSRWVSWTALVPMLLGGLVRLLVFGLVVVLALGLRGGMNEELVAVLVLLLADTLVFGLAAGPTPRQVVEQDAHTDTEDVDPTAQRDLVVVLILGLLFGLVTWLIIGDILGLAIGLSFWLIFDHIRGGASVRLGAALRHVMVRRQLRRARVVPPRLVGFLDTAAEHILLYKVGFGYRFIHLLLRDYFADLPSRDHANG
jgi:hypothetical protein